MRTIIALYGAGGHGASVLDALLSANDKTVVGFLDDKKTGEYLGLPILGTMEFLSSPQGNDIDELFVCIGDNDDRASVTALLQRANMRIATIVHPSATVSTLASVSTGCVVLAQASVGPNARLAAGCIVNTGATVDHDCIAEEYVHISPGAHLAGNTHVGAHTHIGIGSCTIEGVRIGNNVTVGAGSVIVDDLPNNCTAYGNPAKPR